MFDGKIIEKIEKEVGQEIITTACGKWLPDAIKVKTTGVRYKIY